MISPVASGGCPCLLPLHVRTHTASQTVDFLCFLGQRAASTAPRHQNVVDEGRLYASLLSDLRSGLGEKVDVGTGNEENESTHQAVIPHSFSILSRHITGDEIWKQTHPQVTEATEETLLKLAHVGCVLKIGTPGTTAHSNTIRYRRSVVSCGCAPTTPQRHVALIGLTYRLNRG